MADLDAELALFEQEIASLEAAPTAADVDTTTDQPAVIKNEANFVVVDSPASRNATISEAPALYNHAKNGNSGAGGSAALDKPPEPPSNLNYMQALPADIELVANKRLNSTAYENSYIGQVLRGEKKMKRFVRTAGGQTWEDPSLAEWDPNDFRVFCGDLGNEVSDELLAKAFRKYPSFQKAKVVRDSRTNKSKGYGFVSFRCQDDFVQACREMDGKYVGNRPIKLRKSNHKDRDFHIVRKKTKQKQKLGLI
uniref:RNA-binding protein 42 n=1 Tax=Panagrellus redivivus TaxID=6233 RepID=A0A7E4VID1_PANRE